MTKVNKKYFAIDITDTHVKVKKIKRQRYEIKVYDDENNIIKLNDVIVSKENNIIYFEITNANRLVLEKMYLNGVGQYMENINIFLTKPIIEVTKTRDHGNKKGHVMSNEHITVIEPKVTITAVDEAGNIVSHKRIDDDNQLKQNLNQPIIEENTKMVTKDNTDETVIEAETAKVETDVVETNTTEVKPEDTILESDEVNVTETKTTFTFTKEDIEDILPPKPKTTVTEVAVKAGMVALGGWLIYRSVQFLWDNVINDNN